MTLLFMKSKKSVPFNDQKFCIANSKYIYYYNKEECNIDYMYTLSKPKLGDLAKRMIKPLLILGYEMNSIYNESIEEDIIELNGLCSCHVISKRKG